VRATVDDRIAEEAVLVTAVLQDGRRVEVRVDHAIGSMQNPLTDAQLEAKFGSLVAPLLGEAKARAITAACRSLATQPDVRALTALCRP
jgi:2-methylcitrate dehydratase PrpD